MPDPDCVCGGTGITTTLTEGGGNTGPAMCPYCLVPKLADFLAGEGTMTVVELLPAITVLAPDRAVPLPGDVSCDTELMVSVVENPSAVATRREKIVRLAAPIIRDVAESFDYNPGHSDLDDEQPVAFTCRTTLGALRSAKALARYEDIAT